MQSFPPTIRAAPAQAAVQGRNGGSTNELHQVGRDTRSGRAGRIKRPAVLGVLVLPEAFAPSQDRSLLTTP